MKRIQWFFLICCSAMAAKAAPPAMSAGKVAENLMEPVGILANFIGTMSMVIGLTCLFAAFLKYLQHRVNPLATPISTVVFLLIIGVVLVFLPLIYQLTSSGIPFTL